MKRNKTEYPGVFYREAKRIGGSGNEKVFYIVFKKDGKLREEKAGRQYANDMTAAKASRIRADLIEGRRKTRTEQRNQKTAKRWTIESIWEDYKEKHPGLKSLPQDQSRFNKHIQPTIGRKEPAELVPLDIDRIRINLLKKVKPATVKNVMELIRRIISYAQQKQLCVTQGFKIEMPKVNNQKTEDLSEKQMQRLLQILHDRHATQIDGTCESACNNDPPLG